MKIFTLKLAQEIHTKVKMSAALSGKTMLDWILDAIEEKLNKVGG